MPKEVCKYGEDCYRKNPEHLERYDHPEKKSPSKSPAKRTKSPEGSPDTSPKRTKPGTSPSTSKPDSTSKPEESFDPPIQATPRADATNSSHDFGHLMDVHDPQMKYSQKSEYRELLKDAHNFIKNKFYVEMPDDFWSFWDFCASLVKDDQAPERAVQKLGLRLIGPFDVLSGKFAEHHKRTKEFFEPAQFLRHWRFFYDVPEFQSVLLKEKSGVHFGYWRDSPGDKQCYVARNDVNKGCEITLVGGNIFQAVLKYLDKDIAITPFNRAQVTSFKKSLEDWAAAHQIDLKNGAELIKQREKSVVCRTFHKAGIVVPFNRKTEVGYRTLLESDAKLTKLLQPFEKIRPDEREKFTAAMAPLQPTITAAYIAVDECDFGTALELGIDLFCSGYESLHETLKPLLINGYQMTSRPQYIAIAKSHLESRKRGVDVSILD